MDDVEAAIAQASSLPPSERLEVLWGEYERATGSALSRPPSPDERADVEAWVRGHRDIAFVVRETHLRALLSLTPASKAGDLLAGRCPACECIIDADGSVEMDVRVPIDVDPWTDQTAGKTGTRSIIKRAVREAMAKKKYLRPTTHPVCMTVVALTPTGRGLGKKDVDNLVKGLLDTLEGVLYVNDRQVQCLTSRRVDFPGSQGGYLLRATAVHGYDDDIISRDTTPLNIHGGATRINPLASP